MRQKRVGGVVMCVDEIKERESTWTKSFPFFGIGFED